MSLSSKTGSRLARSNSFQERRNPDGGAGQASGLGCGGELLREGDFTPLVGLRIERKGWAERRKGRGRNSPGSKDGDKKRDGKRNAN